MNAYEISKTPLQHFPDAWTRFVGPAPAVRLKAILDLILLLRATQRRHQGERWSRIARGLGLNVDILRERAKARLGKPLNEMTIEDGTVIVQNLARFLAGEEARWPIRDESGA